MLAIILAAGQGLRLRPITEHTPKGLVLVKNRPLLEWTLDSLPDTITEVVFVIGYLGDQIQSHFGHKYKRLKVSYVQQTELLGTADAVVRAKEFIQSPTLVLNGDDLYTKPDLEQLVLSSPGILLIANATKMQFPALVDDQNNFTGFGDIATPPPHFMVCGAYTITPDFFSVAPVGILVRDHTEYSLPHTLAELSKIKPVTAVRASWWLRVGTPEELKIANESVWPES